MYYMYNGHGDTMHLLDNTGAIKNTYDYDIYGKEKTAIKLLLISAGNDKDDWAMDALKAHFHAMYKYLHWQEN